MKIMRNIVVSAVLLVVAVKFVDTGDLFRFGGEVGNGGGIGSGAGSGVGAGAVGGCVGGSVGAGAGVTVPGMNSGYPCELGELGKPGVYENKKEFWGDDSISQGLKRASDAVGTSTRESIRESARKLGVSL